MSTPIISHNRQLIRTHDALHQVMMPIFYSEIFRYPLTAQEVYHACHRDLLSPDQVERTLEEAIKKGYIFRKGPYYSVQNEPSWVENRQDNNQRAKRYLPKVYWVARLIRRFPFVRGVFLSGALSKNVMPKDGDFDFFIVTKPGRLWVCRTLLVLFKKTVLLNSHKYFCVNYFVDTDHLEIEEKNRFTATEIATILPLYNPGLYQRFLHKNQWYRHYFPRFPERSTEQTIRRHSFTQRILERPLRGRLGEWLDKRFLQLTLRQWERKFSHFKAQKFDNTLKSRPYVSKHHPQDFQRRVLDAYQQKVTAFEQRHGLYFERTSTVTDKENYEPEQ